MTIGKGVIWTRRILVAAGVLTLLCMAYAAWADAAPPCVTQADVLAGTVKVNGADAKRFTWTMRYAGAEAVKVAAATNYPLPESVGEVAYISDADDDTVQGIPFAGNGCALSLNGAQAATLVEVAHSAWVDGKSVLFWFRSLGIYAQDAI